MDTKKMRIAVFSFTQAGSEKNRRLCGMLEKQGHLLNCWMPERFREEKAVLGLLPSETAASALKDIFSVVDVILFIGACGIAVRMISPLLASKLTDPAVLVLDEQGQFVIPLLSGHIGGANDFAVKLAQWLNGTAVVTTATDVCGKPAVDVWASEHDLAILPREKDLIKQLSSRVLADEPIGALAEPDCGFLIGEDVTLSPFTQTLHLLPRNLIVGIGCKRGTSGTALETFVKEQLKTCGKSAYQIYAIASISLKQDEKGLLELARKLGTRFWTFPAEELEAQQGMFHDSDFVKDQVGVGNVCERAAMAAAKKAGFVDEKMRFEEVCRIAKVSDRGMTLAVVSVSKKFF